MGEEGWSMGGEFAAGLPAWSTQSLATAEPSLVGHGACRVEPDSRLLPLCAWDVTGFCQGLHFALQGCSGHSSQYLHTILFSLVAPPWPLLSEREMGTGWGAQLASSLALCLLGELSSVAGALCLGTTCISASKAAPAVGEFLLPEGILCITEHPYSLCRWVCGSNGE